MDQARTRVGVIIILISLLLHLCALLFFLMLYEAPSDRLFFSSSPTSLPETVFYQAPSQEESIEQSSLADWAQLKPQAGTLGASMDAEPEMGASFAKVETTEESAISDDQETADQENVSPQQESTLTPDIDWGKTEKTVLAEPPKDTRASSPAKKRAAQKTVAQITRGYLEQLTHEGNNLIKTIGGDPNKRPTAEQLKHERYLAKIQWCLQNSHSINKDKCTITEPIQATMKVYFALKKSGKIESLQIVQSSGNAYVDAYIKALFEHASSSFPPLPSYITEDPYRLLYYVMVNWNTTSPYSMGFYRE